MTVTDTVENFFFIPIVFVGTLVVVAATGWDRQTRQWFHWGAWYLLIGIASMLLMGIVLAGMHALDAGYFLAVLFLASGVAIVTSLIHYGVTSRRMTAINVYSTLGASMRQNLPLPMALDCAAAGADSSTAVAFRSIKTWLVKGCSLADALRRGFPQSPPGALAMVAAGEGIGQLPAALAAIEENMKAQTVGPKRPHPIHPFYPVLVVGVVLFLTVGLFTFVLPQFESVLAEMVGRELPPATRALIEITRAVRKGPYGVIALLVAFLSIWVYLRYRTARREGGRPSLSLWVGDSLAWQLPIVRRFERDRSLVQVLEMLRISLNAGQPVNEAIRSTLELDTNLWFRRRLRCWLERVERGENIAESARGCGLGRPLAWAFDSGGGTANTPTILQMLESHYRTIYSYRLNLTRYILWPVGIVLLGLMVGFIVYAIFSPMVAIINLMALNVYP